MSTSSKPPRLAVSVGEPAGIGPDIALAAAQQGWDCELVLIADRDMLAARAALLGVHIELTDYRPELLQRSESGRLSVLHTPLSAKVEAGVAEPANAAGVLRALDRAADGCLQGEFAAMVTAPVNKAVISDSGVDFTGHTEYLAARTGCEQVVMLLCSAELRVALATTHLPLRAVSDAITRDSLARILDVCHRDLRDKFAIGEPRISVLGLNPHAGENGLLGREEIDTLIPAIHAARQRGLRVSGPWPADTAFNAQLRRDTDLYLAMYHDQGLPVLKYASFGSAVNISLGLPIIRTSVDHGTAFDLAATGRADPGSFFAALQLAADLARLRA